MAVFLIVINLEGRSNKKLYTLVLHGASGVLRSILEKAERFGARLPIEAFGLYLTFEICHLNLLFIDQSFLNQFLIFSLQISTR